jgi:hypothetical protein
MSSTYSTSLQIQLMGNGDQSGTWGSTTNTNWNLMEAAVAGAVTITMSNANYTLTVANGAADQARNMTVIATGTNSGIYQIIAPLVPKIYNIVNNTTGGYAVTVGGSTGATVSIPNGYTCFVYCDGTNFYACDTSSGGNFYVNGTLVATGTTTLSGNASVGGNLAVTGTTTLTGTATAPTQTSGDNSTKIATTAFVTSALQAAYPVGSIYMNASSSTNPATLLGFGTWSALAAGQMLLGNGGGYSAGTTGGSSTTTISLSNLPPHDHSITDPGHYHDYGTPPPANPAGGGSYAFGIDGGGTSYQTDTKTTGITKTNTTQGSGSAFSNSAMTTISPYLVVYMWARTA